MIFHALAAAAIVVSGPVSPPTLATNGAVKPANTLSPGAAAAVAKNLPNYQKAIDDLLDAGSYTENTPVSSTNDTLKRNNAAILAKQTAYAVLGICRSESLTCVETDPIPAPPTSPPGTSLATVPQIVAAKQLIQAALTEVSRPDATAAAQAARANAIAAIQALQAHMNAL